MSAKGNCYDNACAERFFHSLKVETIHGERFGTRDTIQRQVSVTILFLVGEMPLIPGKSDA